ncbi:hypothetical protein HK096_002088 [Nowakowskiella sp. JEL0078]|nr:hypothetical protein HK096_002088 [Nowakowskiella sp. JEL0078]
MKKTHPYFNPIPAYIDQKRPVGKWAGNNYVFEKDFQKREKLVGDCNLGLLVSDEYIVIDVDNKLPAENCKEKLYSQNTGVHDFDTLVTKHGRFPNTLTVCSPSGGKHYYFKLEGNPGEEKLKNWTCCMNVDGSIAAVDIRKKGGYVMVPPSKKGIKRYRWETEDDFKTKLVPLPKWILRNILETMAKHPDHFEKQFYTADPLLNFELENEDIQIFKESQYWQDCFTLNEQPTNNNIINITATEPYDCEVCKRQHVKNSNHPFLVRHCNVLRFVCRPGKGFNVVLEPDYKKMLADFDPAIRKIVETGDITNRTVSQLLYQHVKGWILPTEKTKQWRIFEEGTGTWREENRDVIMRPIVDQFVVRLNEIKMIYKKLSQAKDDIWATRSGVASETSKSLSMVTSKNKHLEALFELIRDNRIDKMFNSKSMCLHFSNGAFDLDKGEFRESRPDDFSMLSTHLEYLTYKEHPIEKCQIVEQYLDDITLGDAEKRKFLLKSISSALDGRVVDQQFYLLLGKGSNSKSLLIKLIKKALGDYNTTMPSAQVTKPNSNAQSAKLEDKVLHTEFLKMIAGGDETSGRGLYQNQWNIQLQAKIFIALNNLPTVEDTTDGFWRKIVIIPFNTKFIDNPQNPDERPLIEGFEYQLLECADTFLALLVDTYVNIYKIEGVKRSLQPPELQRLVVNYHENQNIPLQFYNHCCEAAKDGVLISEEMVAALGKFCISMERIKTPALVPRMYEFLDEKHVPSKKRRQIKVAGVVKRGWRGVKLLDNWESRFEDEDE